MKNSDLLRKMKSDSFSSMPIPGSGTLNIVSFFITWNQAKYTVNNCSMNSNESTKLVLVNMIVILFTSLVFSTVITLLDMMSFATISNLFDHDTLKALKYGLMVASFINLAFLLIPLIIITGIINYLYEKHWNLKSSKVIKSIYALGILSLVVTNVFQNQLEVDPTDFYPIAIAAPICIHLYLFLLEKYVKRYYSKENFHHTNKPIT